MYIRRCVCIYIYSMYTRPSAQHNNMTYPEVLCRPRRSLSQVSAYCIHPSILGPSSCRQTVYRPTDRRTTEACRPVSLRSNSSHHHPRTIPGDLYIIMCVYNTEILLSTKTTEFLYNAPKMQYNIILLYNIHVAAAVVNSSTFFTRPHRSRSDPIDFAAVRFAMDSDTNFQYINIQWHVRPS